ncbi:X-linked retinitis pigmentosa GTPase regulator-interacting protein 1 isoform X1 [Petaurus breviceps papuanus]|uniref:X-linked retinitis pigmentosa GTPase regulator-interacting protein 1 isoform X1 n=1 Tax=Petaurus breviceps papuanus TaxID=3040969 RepID=UPI0036DD4E8E
MIVKREINLLQIQSISFLNNQKCLFFQFQDRVEDLKRERNLLKGNHDRLLKNMLNSSNQPHWSTDLMKERLQQRVSHLQEQLDSEVAEKRKILFQLAKEQAENVDLKEEVTQMLIKHKKEVELLRQKNTTTTTTSSQSDPDFLQPSHQDYTKETQTYEVNSLLEIQEEEKNLTRAYDQMKAAHAETALELEKTRDMLLVQQQINKRYQDELEIVKTKADNNEREHKEEWEKLNQLLDLKNNRIQQLEGNNGKDFGTLDYWMRLKFPIAHCLQAYNKQLKAQAYLSANVLGAKKAQPEESRSETFKHKNQLWVEIIRCCNLRSRRLGAQPSPYAIYQFFTFSDHDTPIIPASNHPHFGDQASFPVHMTLELDRYLRQTVLPIYVFDDNELEIGWYLGKVQVPLLPLAQDKAIQGNFNLNDPVGKPNGSIELKLEWESHYLSPEDLLNSATHSVENDNKAPLSVENYNEVPLSVEKHNEANLQVEDYNETLPSVENKETDLHIEHYNEAPLSVENSEAPLSAKKYNEANLSVEDYNEADLSMESYNEMNLQIEDYEGSLPIENYKVNSSIENNDKVKPSKENCDEARLSIEDFSEAKLSIENFDEAKLFIENLDETKLSTENCEETKQSIENFEEAKLSAENCDETKLSVKNFEEATLSIENCEEDRLPIENCEEDRLPIENCDEDKLSIENSDETTPSIENCDEAKQSIENFEETKLAIENCNEDKLSVENFEEDKLPVENCNEDKLSIENGSEMHLLVEDYNKAPELIENFNEKPIEIPEEENILFHQVNEKKLLGATDDAKKDPEECYPEVKQQEQESPFPDTDYQPSEQADEISETQTTDSDDVIVTPLSHKGPKTNSDKICIEIVSLAFDPEAKVMSDESIQQVYVEYRFHDLPLSETETPVSLRKPRAGEDIHFHFNKVIDLNPVEHGDRRKFLFSMLQEKNPEQRQLKFIVVSDPEEQKNECQEVGYAYLELWQILDTGRDILEQEIDIINSQDKATSIGKLKVSLQATDALQAIFKEMNEDTHL